MIHHGYIRKTTEYFLEHNPQAIVLCEGIDDGFFNTIESLSKQYPQQCIELPCSENASVAMALGAACYGILPIVCFQRVEFSLLALEQLFNNSSKINYLSDSKRRNPSLFRFVIGRGWGQGPSHSQSLEAVFAQIPKLNIYLPVFPEDTKFIYEAFPQEFFPTICLEHRWIHYTNESGVEVSDPSPYVLKSGKEVTIVVSSYNVLMALRIANFAETIGISIEIINLFIIGNNNYKNITNSARKTGRLIVIDLGHSSYGIGNSIIANLAINNIKLKAPPSLLGLKSDYSPSSYQLTSSFYITHKDLAETITKQINIDE